jgi:L-threonylcarbamoyladenylate synthase
MITRRLLASKAHDLSTTEAILRASGIVAVPTETVYGLAADATKPDAVSAIFAAKGRPADHPLIVHIASVDDLNKWAVDIPEHAYTLARAFWPGPLTLLLKKAAHVSPVVTGGLETIGIRVPSHPVLQELLQSSGLGLAAPSANPYKQLSPTNAEQVIEKLDGKIDAVLDGGDCTIGLESTIVDLSGDAVSVLRVGPISPSALSAALNQQLTVPASHNISVPGNVDDHYQPRTPLLLLSREELLAKIATSTDTEAFIVLADFPEDELASQRTITMPAGKPEFAKVLYKTLHDLDRRNLSVIWCELPPQGEEWLDVNDRLQRASHSR